MKLTIVFFFIGLMSSNILVPNATPSYSIALFSLDFPDYCDTEKLDSIKQAFIERGEKFDSIVSDFFSTTSVSQEEFEQSSEQHMDVFHELTNYLTKNHMNLIAELGTIDNYLAEKCYYNFYEVYQMRQAAQWAYQEILGQGIVRSLDKNEGSGGCLIATAAFGSELAPQVQMLRETRDNIVLHTQSGTIFMAAFNSVYYSFAPTVADWERQNPIFKEMVKVTITPLVTTLSILNYVDIDSEAEMLGYGIGVILLNIGIYFVAPAFVIIRLKQYKK